MCTNLKHEYTITQFDTKTEVFTMTKKSNLGNEISIDTKVLVFYMYLKHINRILYVVIRQ